jgi:hypothetical protein
VSEQAGHDKDPSRLALYRKWWHFNHQPTQKWQMNKRMISAFQSKMNVYFNNYDDLIIP